MRSIAPLHAEAQRALEIIADLERGITPPVPIPQMRTLMRARSKRMAADPPAVAHTVDRAIEHDGLAVRVRIDYPRHPGSDRLQPALVWCHGGGFVVGDVDMTETVCRTICREVDIAVCSVDYRAHRCRALRGSHARPRTPSRCTSRGTAPPYRRSCRATPSAPG